MHFVEMQSTVDSETAASVDLEALPSANDTRGKHRILADLKLLDEESRFLEVSPFYTAISNRLIFTSSATN